MAVLTVAHVDAWEELDSRGHPTVRARVSLSDGSSGSAAAPAGASTGRHEAVESRDGGTAWEGRGVRTAVAGVTGEIAGALLGADVDDLTAIDALMQDLDGTVGLSRLGANGVVAVSVACALAVSQARGLPLWRCYTDEPLIPRPMVNIVSGGAHAGNTVDIQDVLAIPIGASSFGEAIEWAARVRSATAVVASRYGIRAQLVADEGGIAGVLPSNRDAVALVAAGIEHAGLALGDDVSIGLDIAASQFHNEDGTYTLSSEQRTLTADELIDEVRRWCAEFPIVSVEDLLGQDDWDGWAKARVRLPGVQLVGDDLFATDEKRLIRGIKNRCANSVLVKVNQAGTLSAAHRVLSRADANGFTTVVSARSGETEDKWLADIAVGWRAGQIKVGSTTRSERTAKWNRLLEICHDNPGAEFAPWAIAQE